MKMPAFGFCLLGAGSIVTSAAPSEPQKDAQGVTIVSGAYVTRVEVWTDHIVRVTRRPAGTSAVTSTSLAVVAKPQNVPWQFADEADYVSLRTSALDVRVDKAEIGRAHV